MTFGALRLNKPCERPKFPLERLEIFQLAEDGENLAESYAHYCGNGLKFRKMMCFFVGKSVHNLSDGEVLSCHPERQRERLSSDVVADSWVSWRGGSCCGSSLFSQPGWLESLLILRVYAVVEHFVVWTPPYDFIVSHSMVPWSVLQLSIALVLAADSVRLGSIWESQWCRRSLVCNCHLLGWSPPILSTMPCVLSTCAVWSDPGSRRM